MRVKTKQIKRRMTVNRRNALENGISQVVNRNNIEGIYGLPDYQIANIMINLFFAEMKRQKKLGVKK